jgi:cellulose synthase/poly-beta-1,6-N-acetylglucosamine synthase-like glycosyltransferase
VPLPLISVLLPARDAAATIGRALASLRRQAETRWECVIVDDGSTDGTAAIARAFADRDGRYQLVQRPHAGLVGALTTGLERCRGRYLARMDADDVMRATRLARQLARLERDESLAGVGTHVRIFPRDQLTQGRLEYERWLNSLETAEDVLANAFVECPLAHPTLMFRTAVLAEHGYRDRGWPEDYDLVLRMLERGERLAVVPAPLLGWRDGPTRLSRTSPACSLAAITACKAAFLASGPLRASDGYVLWGYGDTGKSISKALARHGKHPTCIVERHPRRIGQRILGVPVIAPEALPGVDRRPIVVSVAGAGARAEIRSLLVGMGFGEIEDFRFAA